MPHLRRLYSSDNKYHNIAQSVVTVDINTTIIQVLMALEHTSVCRSGNTNLWMEYSGGGGEVVIKDSYLLYVRIQDTLN